MPRQFTTASERETRAVASELARDLKPGAIVLLSGDLGSGKTAFVRGLAEGLRIDPDAVTSPTFTLVHEYCGGRFPLVHVDLYRLERADLDEVGLDQDLASSGVLAIEWAERLTQDVPRALRVTLVDTGETNRLITID